MLSLATSLYSVLYLFPTLFSTFEIIETRHIRGLKDHLNLTDWKTYVKTFSDFYKDLSEDNEFRRRIFEENVRSIQEWNIGYNKGLHTYKQGINPFTAKTQEEIIQMSNPVPRRERPSNTIYYNHHNFTKNYDDETHDDISKLYRKKKRLPKEFDWRESGIIPEVRYQAECAACYAFTVLDAVEARYNLVYGYSETLSAQMLVDCSQENSGCKGGYLDRTFEYLLNNGGVATEQEYPYRAKVGQCRMHEFVLGYRVDSLVYLPPGDEKGMKKLLVLSGPIAVSLDSEPAAFQKYDGGVFDDPSCKTSSLEHTGLLVGYGTDNGIPYWTVKNSWSEWWGEDGYIRIRRNNNNRCGIASNAIYPIV